MKIARPLKLLVALVTASIARAQTVVHYWDFSSPNDVIGGLVTSTVGPADLSIDPIYIQAYPGAGPSLNSKAGGLSGGTSGYLEAALAVGAGPPLDFGMESFSFSYWCFDDFVFDQDDRGPRVFDCLSGAGAGLQIGTTDINGWNLLCIDDDGNQMDYLDAINLQLPRDQWVHVACVFDRSTGTIRSYVNGILRGEIPFADTATGGPFTGNVLASQSLQIGAIDTPGFSDDSQNQAIDDLAFYSGVLSAADIASLAAGALTPLDFGGSLGTNYCTPQPNVTGSAGAISAVGSDRVSRNDVTLMASGLPPDQFGIFLVGNIPDSNPVGGGVLCLQGLIGRYQQPGQILRADAGGRFSLAIDLTMIPTPIAFVPAAAGDVLYFQAWHRDGPPSAPASNFTDGLRVELR